ncbi:hypothetical protein QLG13_08210 [Rhodococcus aetherivorans]|uniref:hypothetical protein n=1 Tax=Rhodococcus aetherivorans TaxID=191292 RepID=UPI0012DF3454|nr:hypothetical protein [Rhodococcus aetherivorans]
MDRVGEPFVLLIGNTASESATSRLRVGGLMYVRKLLYSSSKNWLTIAELLTDPDLKYVLATMGKYEYERMCDPDYRESSQLVLTGLSKVPHVVLVHEAVYSGHTSEQVNSEEPISVGDEGDGLFDAPEYEQIENHEFFGRMTIADYFGETREETRRAVHVRFDEHGINALPYRTNVERSTLAGSFIDDNERGLLFRIYVPSGRLYADEADRMLRLFRDWISKTGRNSIRQDGYETNSGQVFEFFAARTQEPGELELQFKDFSDFLDACVEDPQGAVKSLELTGMTPSLANEMVSKCSREGRRLQLDLRQTREQRVLLLKHEIESALVDSEGEYSASIEALVQSMVPMPTGGLAGLISGGGSLTRGIGGPAPIQVNIGQQIIQNANEIIQSNVQGSSSLGDEARQLLRLVQEQTRFAEDDNYEAAIYEMEDDDARPEDRITSRQKLKRFLGRVSSEVSPLVLGTLQKYLEGRLGI